MPTIEQYTHYIRTNRKALVLKSISTFISMDNGDFSRAINGLKCSKGYDVKIPSRCLPKLQEYFSSKNIKI